MDKIGARFTNKWVIITMLFLGWSLGNFDRYIMNYAVINISDDFALTATQTGLITSSFFLGYALMQIPGGFLADRFGFRKVLLIALTVWSIFTVLTGFAWSLTSLLLIRFLFGVGEGSFYPSASKSITTWFPENERSRAMSIMLMAGTIMGISTPIIGAVLLQSIGWQNVFIAAGAIGIFFALLFYFFIHEKPKAAGELEEVKETVKFGELLKIPMLWSIFLAMFMTYSISWGLSSWMPKYLADIRGLDMTQIGMISAVPAFVAIVGMAVSGFILDRTPRGKEKILGAFAMIGAGVFLYLMSVSKSIAMFVAWQSIVMIFITFLIILCSSIVIKALPERIAATASGFINTGGQLAGVAAPLIIGVLIDAFGGSYTVAFYVLAAAGIIGAVILFMTKLPSAYLQKTKDEQPKVIAEEVV